MPNQLIHESSPYLLQHANNPVNWLPWNAESLKLAVDMDKPILVSIGYSSCHWCHVMEHESFEDEEVASLMNAHFICIKVDREERPDVDHYYMEALQHMTGRGGWPLNCFALPDGKTFHGGTYYRKNDWMRLLSRVHEEFTRNRAKLEQFAEELEQGIRKSTILAEYPGSDARDTILFLNEAVDKWGDQFDKEWGGFGNAPKFPMPNNLEFLLRFAELRDRSDIRTFILHTLDQMASGGIYDQLGGGFSRYSVDHKWHVPHFEKMLYDNAQLLGMYAQAFQVSKKERYRNIVNQTVDWLEREMKDPSGMFYSGLDADSEGEEGLFYTWTMSELKEILGDDLALADDLFQISKAGYWESDRFILHFCPDTSAVRAKYNLSENQFQITEQQIRKRLMAVRSRRIRPGLDDKCLTSWNSLLVCGLLDAYNAFGEKRFLEIAQVLFNELQTGLREVEGEKELFRNRHRGHWKISAFLDDHAMLMRAAIRMYETTLVEDHANFALELMDIVLNSFYSKETHLFHFSPLDNKELGVNAVEYYDTVMPSSASVLYRNLIWIGRFWHRDDLLEIASDLTDRIAHGIGKWPGGFSNWMQGMMDQNSRMEMIICGDRALQLRDELALHYLPELLWGGSTTNSELPLLRDRTTPDHTFIYFCEHERCKLPVEEVADALQMYRRAIQADADDHASQ
ncbi:MAG: thioredoxin domain-containing protein [Flavobacteriales bacterium]|nr:thioredoxin domain-containing protein [Flavobacteriales bacterium]